MKSIKIVELVGKNAISIQSGKKLYAEISSLVISGEKVELNFEGVSLASPFLNASIGLLLRDISVKDLQAQLSFPGISDVGRGLLNHVIGNAIIFYGDSDNVKKGIDASLEEGDD